MGDQTSDYLTTYRKFFEDFKNSVDPGDQLPVKVAGYNVAEFEISGEVADWALQYLNERKCPPNLLAPIIRTLLDEIHQKCKAQPNDCGYRPQKDDYQSLKLMKAATNQLIDVCKRYLNNAQLSTLPSPPSVILQAPPVSACGVKNARRTMEDRHIALQDLHTLFNIQGYGTASYYAVFDGHNGTDAAVYSVSHLHQFLMESPHYPKDPITALQDAFLKTDDYFKEKCTEDGLKSGTTVVCCLLRPLERMLYVAWAGDSQAVLVKRGVAHQVVRPHKPDRPDEKTRIEDMGGTVLHWGVWRVNGQIAVSRAIGDQMCKPYVIADPEIRAIPLDGTEDFLILACDGLWDVVCEDQAMCAVHEHLLEHPGDLEGVSQCLVRLAKNEGSTDNISVVVVFLSEPSEVVKKRPMESAKPSNLFHKQNGSELFCGGTPNGALRCFQDDEEDFGPETDVDAVDDVLATPNLIAPAKAAPNSFYCEEINNIQHKNLDDHERQRQQLSEFDPTDGHRSSNTPTPPACDDNVAESGGEGDDSDEEEWNYIKGDDKNSTSSLTKEEIEQMESQLNPDAPVFVPDCPKTIFQQNLNDLNDDVISSSPNKLNKNAIEKLPMPTQNDFHQGIINCAGEFNRLNGSDSIENDQNEEKNKFTNFQPDESEVSSTKAECGDDSLFSFTSMNTSTAFSAGIPHDDEKTTSDMLFSNESDFDPSMDAPKELKDLVSPSPEPDDLITESAPTNNIDSSSNFTGFEKSEEVTKELFDSHDLVNHEEDDSQRPLTFAEVLKRPSPRTSPEPPVDNHIEEQKSPIDTVFEAADNFRVENKSVEIEQEKIVSDVINEDLTSQIIDLDKNEDIKLVEAADNNPFDLSSDLKSESNKQETEIAFMQENSLPSFVTVRKSSVDNTGDSLKSPEDEKPPQFFKVDENLSHFENFEQKPKEDLMESLMPGITSTDNIQFMSMNSESSFGDVAGDVDTANEPVKVEELDVAPEDLQFGTVDAKLEFNSNVDFLSSDVNQEQPKEVELPITNEALEVNENHFDIKPSPTELKDPAFGFDINESHFTTESTEIFTSEITEQKTEENFESKFDAQEITIDSKQTDNILNASEFVPHVDSPIKEQEMSFDNFKTNDLQNPFSEQILVSQVNDLLNESDNKLSQNETVTQAIVEDIQPLNANNPFASESNGFIEEKENVNAFMSVLDTSSALPAAATIEEVHEKRVELVFDEPIINDQRTIEPVFSPSVRQQEETLEQTINVDFIPAEPLSTPETPKEDALKVEEKSESVITVAEPEPVEESKPLTTETPPPTPAPGVAEETSEDKDGLLAAVTAAAAAGAAVVGVTATAAAKTAVKKTTAATATKKPAATGAKKPTDLTTKPGAKTSTTSTIKSSTTAKSALTAKTSTTTVGAAKKPLSSSSPASRPAPKPTTGAKSSPITKTSPTKPTTPTSRTAPNATSRVTTTTATSRPSSVRKTSPTKPVSSTTTAAKPKVTDKKPLTNGDIPKLGIKKIEPVSSTKPKTIERKPLTNGEASKPGLKKPELTTARKPLTNAKPATTAASRPIASKTTSTLSKVSSTTKTATSITNKPKTTTTPTKTTSTLASKTKPITKPTDKTGKDAVNKQISSPRTPPAKVPLIETTNKAD